MSRHSLFLVLLAFAVFLPSLGAKVVEYDLTVEERQLAPAGKKTRALTLNGGIPGPTLRVHNRLKREETSIHWHGLLLPNEQDGVPVLTTPPILAGTSHTFEFQLRHSGTYWYHSHTGLQEQSGVYGSIVVEPKGGEPVRADREHVLVLSDWTNENPMEVMRSLMRGSEYYAIRKGTLPTITGALRAGAFREYLDAQKNRMPAMDISDVAYDAFLINGRPDSALPAKPGESVRLRLINAGASTYFYVESATGPLTIVASDGPPVRPIQVKRLFIGMGETYDVIVKVPAGGSWEVRATAQDGSGHASVFLGDGPRRLAPDVPKPDVYRMDETLLAAITEAEESAALNDRAALAAENPRPLSPYPRLRALKPTVVRGTLPTRTIKLRLNGDMTRYVWSINGKTFAEDSTILIKRGEVIRLEMVNDTMMHHPMHLHGHFFRVIDDEGTYSPLKHTIDVPPMGKRTVEFLANEERDWLFHCHLLYHMEAGMTRVFRYEGTTDNRKPRMGTMSPNPTFFMLEGTLMNNMSMGMLSAMNQRNNFTLSWDVGWAHEGKFLPHRHEDGSYGVEYEVDFVWERYFNPNLSTFLGFRWTNEEDVNHRAIAGINYRLPYLIESTLGIDSDGAVRVSLGKMFEITSRFSTYAHVQYDTRQQWEWTVGAAYVLTKQISLQSEYHSSHGVGVGFGFRF
jgi:FtsP/CotA-like multicopper oxidase with cupredoxin domain